VIEKTFRAVSVGKDLESLRDLFRANWPSYKRWFFNEGERNRASYLESRQSLSYYMPELMPLYDSLLTALDCDDQQARFLCLYNPPPVASACSQFIVTKPFSVLIRNYDFPPQKCDGIILCTTWGDARVLAMGDCIWGVLDGVNSAGLAVSLSLGGAGIHGDGFGVTLILRYLLQTCDSVDLALKTLGRIPISMDYNIALVDSTGDSATAYVAPLREPQITAHRFSANHPPDTLNCRLSAFSDSRQRQREMKRLDGEADLSPDEIGKAFLKTPIYRPYERFTSGTLYTVLYYPASRQAAFHWPGRVWQLSLDHFQQGELKIRYGSTA
jgi:predicted choloylglycine hydrolase